jgi:hypothetical protein
LACHERRHPAQRSLLVSKPCDLVRLAVFEKAVAMSAVNSARRSSMRSGNGSPSHPQVAITPHTRPSTMIGAPAPERMPFVRAASAIAPASSA